MSSNGEKRMMKRSDFAQKLLDDLRVRKEQLSGSKNCLPTDSYAYSNRGCKGSRAKSTTFQELTSSSIEASNQLVPYGKGRSMEKIDLSKALAFALENAGKATRGDPSGSASIISFLHEVGKRSLGERRSSQVLVQQQQPSSSSPMIHVHIKEISKGAQKLNQIIKAYSNGLSFRKGRYSIQCGEQLMEGAIDLEQSLRLLVDIQQASEYTTNKQRKNRIKLLEENDDDEDQDDAHNQNYQKIKEVAKADIEMRLLALNYQEDNKKNKHRRTSSCGDTEERSLKPQKGRIPSVVAKLMGLGEFPEDEKETNNKNVTSTKSAENLTRRRVMQASANLVEQKAPRKSTSLDLVVHKETQTASEMNYKAKSQQKDREKDDSISNSRKRSKVSYKKDGEVTTKNVVRRNPSPTEHKHKVVARKPLQKLSSEKKLIFHKPEEEESIKKERFQREYSVKTNQSPKLMSSVDIQKKLARTVTEHAKAPRKSFCHVEVAQKAREGEVHKAKIREKKNQDIYNQNEGLCKVMKRPEIKKADGKQDQLLRSDDECNKTKAEAETYIKNSHVSGVEVQSSNKSTVEEHKRGIKDDSILLIAAERVTCQAPLENHHGILFTDGIDQQAPISKFNGNSERLPETICKGTKGEVEAGLPLLEKRQEKRTQETTETLSENEINLKKIFVKSQLFLDTAKALFKLNIPPNVFHDASVESNYYQEDKNLILECGFELMKRKRRFQELSVHPFVKVPISSSKVNSLDHLIRQMSKELEKLRAYGRDYNIGSHVEDYVLERDVHHKDPNLNSMWDMGWNDSMLAFIEKDDVMRDIEREVFSGLLEEITRDLICI
ncbi:PREDICTED: uncharacterized protein LOC104771399 [Camelina sativa]|uniref:Uncharacterized protein LOC104771399 n=1 Tax=Camelina sativa TaxID=90675 RepID=A0ABM0Y1W5_CAMSA|nr:PREDICTED: uncharacterized protein LOC104771399 [Camelina sativa]